MIQQRVFNRYFRLWLLAALPFFLFLSSCDKYLGVEPKGKRLLKTTNDFELWLNSRTVMQSIPNELNLLDDLMDDVYVQPSLGITDNRVYTWQRQYSLDPAAAPVMWRNFYESIYYFNTVLVDIDEAEGPGGLKRSLKAEALLGRAFNYLYLVNLYGKPYNATTASTDPAVPFVISNDLNDPTPPRSSVKEIYDHIINDLVAAIPDLPADNSRNRYRGTVAAAYSVLARTYLYMGDFEKAAANAQLALDNGQTQILDFSTMSGPNNIPQLIERPGVIYGRMHVTSYTQFIPALWFLKTFDRKDLRLSFYYTSLGDYSFNVRGQVRHLGIGVYYSGAYPNCGTSVEEMRLILAEAAARKNDLQKALDELDRVRKTRFKPADYVRFESADQEEVLRKILTERTFEFAYNGMRWFDMRRLDTEGRMSTVTRLDGQGNVIGELPPHSEKYTLQVPLQVISFNTDWPQNSWPE